METSNKQQHENKLTYHGVTWIDVQDPNDDVLSELKRTYSLHPIHLQESTQAVQHNQVERGKGYLFFVIHFPVYHAAARKITFGQLGIFLGKDYIITIRNKEDAALEGFYNATADPEIGKTHFGRGAAYLLYLILDKLLGELSVFTYKVMNELDDLEDDVFESNGSDAQEIGKMRQKIVRLMQLIGPKRAILEDLAEQVGPFAGHEVAKYYSNSAKTVNKLWEIINEAKETVEIYKDADFTISTEQTNQILTVLTLIFTFTIPVTVFGALYGMNVLLPGGIEAGSWTFLGRYTMFVLVVALSVLLAIVMYIYFKKRRWI